ncbi:MAG: Glu-tRNA(Gln) amidotransferase subunit GatE [Candidatus Woesearchaeota archaeon]
MDSPNLKKELSDDDVKRLGLKSGLEIHQQLEGRKLFCHCPTEIRDDEPDFTVRRYIRASAGESGTIDAAALAEMRKGKYYLYQGYHDTTCLVELDEEPPGPVNPEALYAALQVASVFSMSPVDQARFMRKTVVDGSNTSGFQRTGLIAVGGSFELESGLRVGVETLCLEEDACKKVKSVEGGEVFNLSRLGIPLLEVATAPDLKSPSQVREAAEHIGMVMRSLPNVKRGLGTIRQDVNVSIADGVRVEIKGAQDLKTMEALVRYEALRQKNMLMIFDELKARNASVKGPKGGVSFEELKSLKSSSSKVIRVALDKEDGVVLGAKLEKFGGLLGLEVQPGRRFGSELSDHAKVMGVKGLFHSDELPKYGITQEEKDAVFKELGADPSEDAFIIIAAEKRVAELAISNALLRASDFSLRSEVRNAKPDGSTAYLRPMPGAARMYPETDVKPVLIDMSGVETPELLSDQVDDLKGEFGLSDEVARRLLKDGVDLKGLSEKYGNVKPAFIVDLFYSTPALVKKKFGVDVDMSLYADEVLAKVDAGVVSKDSVPDIVAQLAKGEEVDYGQYRPVDTAEVDSVVKQVLEEDPDAPVGALMGAAMKRLGGKADGKVVMQRLKELKG